MKIFDPLSTIIKLGILSKKPLGTKLSIKNNTIDIQEVSYYQGIYRYFNNDIDDDIQFLIKPVDMACQQYLSIEYIKKYPSSVRKVLKEKPDLDKKDLCFWVAQHNQERAHDLLHKILKERMRRWWD